MGWEITVRHDELGERVRLTIEAGSDVPQDVISTVAEAYWSEVVQFDDSDWVEDDDSEPDDDPPTRFHG